MRQIKFRGLRTDGLGWAYGSLCPDRDGDPNIIMPLPWPPIFRFKVKPETVGQFTGVTDCDDTDVYEGDLIDNRANGYVMPVQYVGGCFCLSHHSYHSPIYANHIHGRICGNIHEQ